MPRQSRTVSQANVSSLSPIRLSISYRLRSANALAISCTCSSVSSIDLEPGIYFPAFTIAAEAATTLFTLTAPYAGKREDLVHRTPGQIFGLTEAAGREQGLARQPA